MRRAVTTTVAMALGVLLWSGTALGATFSSGKIDKRIPDLGRTVSKIKVPADQTIADIQVAVRLRHGAMEDLLIGILGPGHEFEELASQETLLGKNLGTGKKSCGGTPTVFDDTSGTPIASGSDPYAGSFDPDESIDGWVGESAKRTWKLIIFDLNQDDQGTLYCWQLGIGFV